MTQSYSFSRSPTLSRFNQLNPKPPVITSFFSSNNPLLHKSLLCPVHLLSKKRIYLKLFQLSYQASVFRVQLKLKLILLLLVSSMYIFNLNRLCYFFFSFLYITFFFSFLVILLKLVLHRFPSIRNFLTRIFCNKLLCFNFKPPIKHHTQVVWSIGSKPKLSKSPKSGSWVKVYTNGDVYEGEFHKGKSSGSGVYYYNMSGRYEGDWIDEKCDGYGVETWSKGSRYRGQYRQGMRHGVGLYRSYTGDMVSGEWSNGHCHGYGVHSCEDGSSYVGQFKCGAKHGLGHYHFRNGDTYGGEYFADKIHGFGSYQFGNGHRYEGGWHEGRRQGYGTYTFRNGETQSGYWQNGALSVPSSSIGVVDSAVGSSSFVVDHAKVFHAVQEARRAAKEAVELPNMDGRVKKAVATANKAASAARVAAVKAVQIQMHNEEKNISNHRRSRSSVV